MKIKVSGVNEFPFYPKIANNLDLPIKDRFTIILKKINASIDKTEWISYDEDGKYFINQGLKILSHIKRIDNAPDLQKTSTKTIKGEVKEIVKEIPLVAEDLVSDEFPELFDLTFQLMKEITKLHTAPVEDIKKS